MIKTKKIMFAIALASAISTCTSHLAYATNLKSNIDVKNYTQLEDELAKAISQGYTETTIKFDNDFFKDFCKNGNQKFKNLMNKSGYKSKNDYYANELHSYSYKGQGINSITFTFKYLETEDETRQVNEKVKEIIKNIIKPNMSEDKKVKEIHDYIVTHVEYDKNGLENGNEAHTAYAGLFYDKTGEPNETVCQGYALLFYKIAKEAGLEARIMTGESFSKSASQPPQAHAWNLIKINGNWYQMDLTWDDPLLSPRDKNYKRYNYFNLSDEEMQNDHTYNDPDEFPKCNTKYKDIATNELLLKEIGRSSSDTLLVANTKNELMKILLDQINKGKIEARVKYPNKKDINDVMSELINRRLIENTGWNISKINSDYIFNLPLNPVDKLKDLNLSKDNYKLIVNKDDEFKIIAKYENGKEKNVTSDVELLCSDNSVISIDKVNYKIHGKKEGTTFIKLKYGDKEKTISVEVSKDDTQKTQDEQAKLDAEKKAKEQQAKLDAEKKAKEEQARLEAEKKAKEQQAKLEAEKKAKEQQAKLDAEKKAKEEQARLEAEKKAKEQQARLEAEKKAKEQQAKLEAEKKAKEQQAKLEAEKKAKDEQARLDAEKKAKEQQAKLEAEKKAKEQQAKLEAEKKAKEQQAKLDAEKKAKEEQAKLDAEKKAKEEQAKLEAEKKAKDEQAKLKAEKKAKEQQARLEAEKKAKEQQAKLDAEKKAKDEQAKLKAEKKAKEQQAKLEAEKKAKEKQARLEAEKKAKEQQAKLDAEKKAKEEQARLDAEKKAKESHRSHRRHSKKHTEHTEHTYYKNDTEFINNILESKESKSVLVEQAKKIIKESFEQEKIKIWENHNTHKTKVNHNFTINFNKKINIDNLDSNVILFNKHTGEKLDLDFELNNSGTQLLITKKEDFDLNNEYILFINNDLTDVHNHFKLNKVIIMNIHC